VAFAAAVLAAILILPAGWDEADSWFDEILHAPGTRAARAVPQRVDGRPLVVVEPLDDDEGAAGLSLLTLRDLVLDGLARFDEISVVDQGAGTRVASDADRYLLAVRAIPAGEAVTVSASLSHAPSGKVVWARSFDPAKRSDPESPPEPDIARQIATSVGQPYGVLFADLRARPDLDQRTRCIVQTYDHWRLPSRDSHARGRDCLEAIVREQPHAATAFANLADFYLEEFRIGHNARPDPLERALRAARRAIEIAPESPRTNQALMDVLFARDDVEAALARGRRALELNPYDTDILAGVGAKLVQTGRYREGAELIQKAEAANAAPPPWYDFYLFLAAFMQDDWLVAKPAAARIEPSDFVLGLLAKIAVAARERRQAPDLIARLVAIQPEFGTNPQSALAKRNFDPAIQSRLLEALRQAGLRA
jgi:TolB-like protein